MSPQESTATQDISDGEGWLSHLREESQGQSFPTLRLLYHCDLDRVGGLSLPGSIPLDGSWVLLGRNEPLFLGSNPTAAAAALDDPYVSREQVRLRWLPREERFEVEPGPSARRPLIRVDLDGEPSEGRPPQVITGPTVLAPGACLAIGDRVLLGLDLCRFHRPDADRLGLVGEGAALWFLRDEIRALAGFDRPTLVTGPTGAGKELVASALHRQSARAGGPFLPVNCAALPEALLESVLFGHRRGAFTGADRDEKGLFRAADGGTLFLDEVGEMPLVVQPKLLRVLQDQVVMPVGAHEGHRVNVRVLAATHRDLAAQVREGRLREDLYHRIAAHVLRVPSLRERRLDIPELFFHMLRRHRAEHPALGWLWAGAREWKPVVPIGFLAGLMGAPWTGNVRELQNVVERTVLLNLTPGSFRAPGAPALAAPPSSPRPATSPSHASGPRPTTSPSHASGPHLPEASLPAASSLSASSPRLPVADLPPSNPPGALASPVPPEPSLGDALRAAGEALGLAPKTIRKLLPPESLQLLQASADRDGGELTSRLRAQAVDALLALLDAHDFNQSSVAQALAVSRTTLLKIMDDLALPRAGDLTADAIAAARAHASGDLAVAARALRVSAAALRKRIAQLDRGPDGE